MVSTSETSGKPKSVGKLHETHRLAIAFRPRHAKIMFDSGFGAGSFFLAKDADGTAAKPAETADDRCVLAKMPVARQGRKVAHEGRDKIAKMRPLRMPCDLRLLPGRQIGIKIGKRLFGLRFEPGQFLANGNGVAFFRELAEFQNLGFEFCNRFFKIEIASHCRRKVYAKDFLPWGRPPHFRRGAKRTGNSRTVTNTNALLPLALQARGNSPFCAAKSRYRAGRRARFGPKPALCRVRGGFAGQHRVKRADVACGAKFRRNSWVAQQARHPRQRFQMVGTSCLRCD